MLFVFLAIFFLIFTLTANSVINNTYVVNGGIVLYAVISFVIIMVFFSTAIYLYEYRYYKAYYYDLKNDAVVIRKGVFIPQEITIPYVKVQNVFVDRDFLDIAFGLYDVHLETAAMGSVLSAHIDGVDNENAAKLKNILLRKINANKGSGV
jgi:membrane protein YdbS with pleckstrin-like domain